MTTSTSMIFILMFAIVFGLEQWVSRSGKNYEKTFSTLFGEFSCFLFFVDLIITTTFSC